MIRQSREHMHLPIVFLTSRAEADHRILAVEAGGDEFLVKGTKQEALVSAVNVRARRARVLTGLMSSLRGGEQRFRSVMFSAGEAIICCNARGAIILWNAAASRIFGYTEQAALGQPITMLVPEHQREILVAEAHRGTGDRSDDEVRTIANLAGVRSDGGSFSLEVSVAYWKDGGHRLVTFIARDVTEQRDALALLEQQVAARTADVYLRDRAMEASTSGMNLTDARQPDNPIVYANPAFAALCGYSIEEMLGRNCRFLHGDDSDQPGLEELRAAIRERRSVTTVVRNYRKDGSQCYTELHISPILDAAGVLTHFVGIHVDVTKRERHERELTDREHQLRLLTDALPVLVFCLDSDQRYRMFNKTGETWYGRPRESFIGQTMAEALSDDRMEHLRPYVMAALAGRQVSFEETVAYFDGKNRDFHITYIPHRGEGDHVLGFFGLTQDLTETHQIHETLQQAQKMEAIGQLTGGIAHDFNNQLALIIGNLDLQSEFLDPESEAATLTKEALDAGLRSANLISRLLDLSRNRISTSEPVDIAKSISGMQELLARSLGERLVLDLAVDPEPWPILADPAEVESAVLNLAVNAHHAMPNGGRIRVEVENCHLSAPDPARHRNLAPGEYVLHREIAAELVRLCWIKSHAPSPKM